jgi:hypothetical protein
MQPPSGKLGCQLWQGVGTELGQEIPGFHLQNPVLRLGCGLSVSPKVHPWWNLQGVEPSGVIEDPAQKGLGSSGSPLFSGDGGKRTKPVPAKLVAFLSDYVITHSFMLPATMKCSAESSQCPHFVIKLHSLQRLVTVTEKKKGKQPPVPGGGAKGMSVPVVCVCVWYWGLNSGS